jgi:plastocyanin
MSKALCICAVLALGSLAATHAQEVTASGRIELAKDAAQGRKSDAANIVVWLTPLADSPSAGAVRTALARQPVRLLQKNKSFQPHILIIMEGSQVEFPNADPFFHNVFSLFEGKRFDLGLYEAGSTRTLRFDRPGISYIFCNIHPQMSAVIIVLRTPYFGVSDGAGRVTIPHVPSGNYLLRVWDEGATPEELKSLQGEIMISERTPSLGTIRLTRKSILRLGHKNKYGRDYENPTPSSPAYKQP